MIFSAGTTNAGFNGAGGGGVPSGMLPRMRAVEGTTTGAAGEPLGGTTCPSSERADAVRTKTVINRFTMVFIWKIALYALLKSGIAITKIKKYQISAGTFAILIGAYL